jgi:hypothetical protein
MNFLALLRFMQKSLEVMIVFRKYTWVLVWLTFIVPSPGAYLQVLAGKNPLSVRLKAGWVDLTFGFNTHADSNGDDVEANGRSVTIIVQDLQGHWIFRQTPPSAFGWYHGRFYNPEDQVVSIWARGAFAILPSQGGGIYRSLNANGTLVGGDAVDSNGNNNPGVAENSPSATPPPTTAPPAAVAPPRPPEIHAVIISGQSDPTKILRGNVHLVGGLIALGRQPGTPGTWDPGVTITPDSELITGQKVPPITPNLFDVRITRYEISATLDAPPAAGQ